MKKREIILLSAIFGSMIISGSVVLFIFLRSSNDLSYTIDPDNVSILMLGDSYTEGESVPLNDSGPLQLKEQLIDHNITVGKLDIIAKTGWTSYDLLQNISNTSFNGTYDFVTLLIGVNDQFQGISAEECQTNF